MATDNGVELGRGQASRHLGLDLGGTNLKWTVVEHEAGDWRVLDRGHVPTRTGGPDAIVPQLAEVGRAAIERWPAADRDPAISTAGIGIPGLYDPRTGATRFLVNIPGPWDGYPVAGPVATELGVPVALINDARAFGLAELRLGAGRGASSMVGLTLGTGVGGVIRDILGAHHRAIACTDILCFGPASTPDDEVPEGVLPPRRIMCFINARE